MFVGSSRSSCHSRGSPVGDALGLESNHLNEVLRNSHPLQDKKATHDFFRGQRVGRSPDDDDSDDNENNDHDNDKAKKRTQTPQKA